ncbi:AraC family transcriptional regulator [Rubellicoccus peritrichatus]|uniref:AraC family transcriptional regulator n=1 Tax=Rubellicoccus peritrichatus TaxID=3080537 RepID=A0AAQ3L7Q0_9BACT|nr:AraC family transcriptional regulator [Puniceicoccus sp. CR14]WOO40611.1 AraC family transcriptional regulator [Puniceicoccus sp. CR14]
MTKCVQDESGKGIREGFIRQRLAVVPPQIIKRCQAHSLVSNLYITDIGEFPLAENHYVSRKEAVAEAILIYCLDGSGEVTIEDQSYTVKPGNAVVIPPNQSHTYRASSNEPWSIFWIHFGGEQLPEVMEYLIEDRKTPLLFVPDRQIMKNAFEDIYVCLSYNYSDAGLLAMSTALMSLVSKIKLHHKDNNQEVRKIEQRVAGTIAFMHEHLHMHLCLRDFARRAGMSGQNYSKRFKAKTGQSPMAYFIQLKIQKACRLLIETEQSIGEISQQLGYEDQYYFSRQFKKVQGCSPSHYRGSVGEDV